MSPFNTRDAERILHACRDAGKTRVVAVEQRGKDDSAFTVYQTPYQKSTGYSLLKPKSYAEQVRDKQTAYRDFKRIADRVLGRSTYITLKEIHQEVSNASV